jgi:hypothetical protein
VFSGLGMLTILTIDLAHGLSSIESQALFADARVVYGSQDSLYVATDKWVDPTIPVDRLPQSQSTVIDQFDVTNPDQTMLVASGEVPGYVLNQFSLSEYGGHLRVASTSRPIWWGDQPPSQPSQSDVTVLSDEAGVLTPVGQVSGLGLGQKIYSVRFIGDAGYVVTYRQVDPLYTLDLSVPTAPRVAGALELAGYSSYLQPLGSGLLLGIGQDVGANNEPAGSQLEVFDVSKPAKPALVGRTALGAGSSSTAEYDHHAFLYWPATGLAVLPVEIFPVYVSPYPVAAGGSGAATTTGQGFTGAIGFHIDGSGITELGAIAQPAAAGYTPQILRSIVVGSRLFTVSDEGVMGSSLSTLAPLSFAAFPQPATVVTVPPPGIVAPPTNR